MSAEKEEAVPLKARGKSKKPEIVATTTYEFPYMRKPTERSFRQVVYDRENGKFFGRTPRNWGKIELERDSTSIHIKANLSDFMAHKNSFFPHVLLIYHSSNFLRGAVKLNVEDRKTFLFQFTSQIR
jgi:hypothetical protein